MSDGSYDQGQASYAFLAQPDRAYNTFATIDFDELLYGTGDVIGSDEDINAYRAELTGILAAISFTNDLCNEFEVQQGTCTLFCDSNGALAAAFGHKRPTIKWLSFDIVWQI